MIVKRGDLGGVSKSFPELVGKYRGGIQKALEGLIKASASKALGPALLPHEKKMMIDYVMSVTKLMFPIYLPNLAQMGDDRISAGALRIFNATVEASDLYAACIAYGVDPVSGSIRLTNADINYVQATLYYTFRGTVAECFQGSVMTTDINRRREFAIYAPSVQLAKPRYDISRLFTEVRREVRM
jgi:hypothetical protein